jgi:hypothetical protein
LVLQRTLLIAVAVDPPPLTGVVAVAIAVVMLAVEMRVQRPRRRFDAVGGAPDGAGDTPTRPDTGPGYVPVEIIMVLEVAKVAALAVGAGALLAM